MPLSSIDSSEPISSVPHSEEYAVWTKRLAELSGNVLDAINERFDELISKDVAAGGEVFASSYLPERLSSHGSEEWEWPFQTIWETACRQDYDQTKYCF